MIIYDTETTSLISNTVLKLELQPKIIEFYGIRFDPDTFEIENEYHTLINPGEPLTQETIDITHITDEMLADAPSFPQVYFDLVEFFLGERAMAAHNLSFDRSVLIFELQRIDCQYKFPYPPVHICTVEQTEHIKGKRLNLTDLHQYLFEEERGEKHRAKADVDVLFKCWKELRQRKIV